MINQKDRRQVTVLATIVFVDLLGLALILPSLPFFVLNLNGTGVALGLILTAYSLTQVVAAPILGRLSDRYGRPRLLLLSLAGSAASFALAALAHDLPTLVIARVLAGLCGGSITIAYALAADITSSEDRAAAMSRVGLGIGSAFTIGPAIGALLAPQGFALVCWVGALIAAANLIVAWRVLPRRDGKRVSAKPHRDAPATTARSAGYLMVIVAGGAVITWSFVSMETTFGLLTNGLYGYGAVEVGWVLAAAGLVMMLVQASLGIWGARRPSDWTIVATAAGAVAASLFLIPVHLAPGTVLSTLFLSGAYGAFVATQASLVSQAGPPARVGARMGLSQGANAAGRALGPITAGVLYDWHAPLPYLVAGTLTAVVAATLTASRLAGRGDAAKTRRSSRTLGR